MSRRYGRLVDACWIRQRMDQKDARVAREMRARAARRALGLEPEVVPYASVEIIRVDAPPPSDDPKAGQS
jgi:hypothetical protein